MPSVKGAPATLVGSPTTRATPSRTGVTATQADSGAQILGVPNCTAFHSLTPNHIRD